MSSVTNGWEGHDKSGHDKSGVGGGEDLIDAIFNINPLSDW